MKILVMSLLRIGDIVLSTPVLRGLRDRYPDAEIHLLINSQFKQISPLIPYINQVRLFDRDLLQKGLGEASVPLFESYERVHESIDSLNSESYDMAVNLTHSRLSGWIMSVLTAKDKIGLCFDGAGRASFGSGWFRYLNNQVDAEGADVFHFTDVFRFALEVGDEGLRRPALVETSSGRTEAEAFIGSLPGEGPILTVQALTSDSKKDWGLARYAAALQQFHQVCPKSRIVILGAPFEKDKLAPLMQALREKQIPATLGLLSFEGAFSLLKKSRLLLTGDTSIKHLACAARTPVLEISIGSADFHRTGSYLHGSVILQSKELCAPCVHSKPCHRSEHFCALKVPTEAVAMTAIELFERRVFQLKTIAEEYRDEVEILKVESRESGFWAAYSVLEPFAEETVGHWIDLACRKLWIEAAQSSSGNAVQAMGTEILQLSRLLRTIHPEVSDIEWTHLLADFEKQIIMVDSRINGFNVGIQYLRGTYEDPKRLSEFIRGLISLREKIRHSPLLRSFKQSLDYVIEDDISPAFTRFKRIVEVVSEIERRTAINMRLVRGLASEFAHARGLERT